MDLSRLAIVRCSDDQKLQARKNHYAQWGQPLGFTEQDWVRRFELLEEGEWAADDRYVNWWVGSL